MGEQVDPQWAAMLRKKYGIAWPIAAPEPGDEDYADRK